MRFAALIGGVVLLASCGEGDSSSRPDTSHLYKSGKIKMISRGKAYSKEDVAAPGKAVLLEITAPW